MFRVVYMYLGTRYAKSEPFEIENEAMQEAWSFNTMNGRLLKNKLQGVSCDRPDRCYAKVVEE